MTYLDTLKKLALAATINGPDATIFVRPQSILQLIAVIEAAKAPYDWGRPIDSADVRALDAALAKLEKP